MTTVSTEVMIDAPAGAVWATITDIENSMNTIEGIDAIEILDRPAEGAGIRGLRWRETRTMFGKQAIETMWITDVVERVSYDTEARSHGSIYRTRFEVSETPGGTRLVVHFSGEPTSTVARIFALVFGRFMAGSIRKALQKDLADIRVAAEARAGGVAS